jgi:RNA polymerase sigma-70 factor (ECF subfamily)
MSRMLGADTATKLGEGVADDTLVKQVLSGDARFFEVLMRRHNPRVFRAARAILGDDEQAEEIMQETYVRAYTHLVQFEGRASFATWLTRIAVHEAFARRRKLKQETPTDPADFGDGADEASAFGGSAEGPEDAVHRSDVRRVLSRCVDALPESLRTVFVLRAVEGMSVTEVAECLELSEDNVKVRLHRARSVLQKEISATFEEALEDVFSFHLARCDRVVRGVLERIASRVEH